MSWAIGNRQFLTVHLFQLDISLLPLSFYMGELVWLSSWWASSWMGRSCTKMCMTSWPLIKMWTWQACCAQPPHFWTSGFCAVLPTSLLSWRLRCSWADTELCVFLWLTCPIPMTDTVHTSFCNSLKYWWQRFPRDAEEVLQGLVGWSLN